MQAPFPRISYDDAVKTLKEKGLPIEWGGDFGGPDETALSEQHDRPLMVHHYPSAVKAFYMKRAACLWRGRVDTDADGNVAVPQGPGLGCDPDMAVVTVLTTAAEIEEVIWIDPATDGNVILAPLTRDLILPFYRASLTAIA